MLTLGFEYAFIELVLLNYFSISQDLLKYLKFVSELKVHIWLSQIEVGNEYYFLFFIGKEPLNSIKMRY